MIDIILKGMYRFFPMNIYLSKKIAKPMKDAVSAGSTIHNWIHGAAPKTRRIGNRILTRTNITGKNLQ